MSNGKKDHSKPQSQYCVSIDVSFAEEQWIQFFAGDFYLSLPQTTQQTINICEKSIVVLFVQYFDAFETETAKCTFRAKESKMYMCSDCQYDKYAFFCFDCFDPKKHIGHHYYVTEGSGACDCGNEHLWNAQTFCNKHKYKITGLKKVSKEKRKKFSQFFKGCLSLYIQFLFLTSCNIKKSKKITEAYQIGLFSELKRLVAKNESYIELVAKILLSTYCFPCTDSQYSFLHYLINWKKSQNKLMYQMLYEMLPNRQFIKRTYQILFQSKLTFEDFTKKNINSFIDKIEAVDEREIFNELADKGIIFKAIETNGQYKGIKQFYLPILKCFKNKKETSVLGAVWKQLDKLGYLQKQICKINQFQLILNDLQQNKPLLEEIFSILLQNSTEQLKKKINEKQAMSFITDLVKSYISISSKNQQFSKYNNVFSEILTIYGKYCIYHPENMDQITLKWLIEHVDEESVKNIYHKIWTTGVFLTEHLVTFTAFMLKNFIGNSFSYQVRFRYYLYKQSQIQQNTKRQQTLFQELLCSKESTGLSTISDLRDKGYLSFKDADKILKENTVFNEQNKRFYYNGSNEFINHGFLLKNILNFQQIPPIKFRGNQIKHKETLKPMFERIFTEEFFWDYLSIIEQKNPQKIQYSNLEHIKNRFGFVMVLNMIVIDQVLQGENTFLRQKLQAYQNEDEQIKFFKKTEGMQVPLLFQKIAKSQKKAQNQSKQTQANKLKKLAKFKEKQKQVIARMNIQEQEPKLQCLICKDIGDKDNKIYNLAYIQKNQFINNYIINTCLHTIHEKCFFNLLTKDDKTKYCPLCSKVINFILPTDENMNSNHIFMNNLLVQIMTNQYKDYYPQPLYLMVFNTLLSKHGIISTFSYQILNFTRRGVSYLENYLAKTYNQKNKQQKQEMMEEILKIKDKNQKEEKKAKKLINQLIFQYLVKKVILSQQHNFTKETLISLQKQMKQEEFTNFMNHLNELSMENINIEIENDSDKIDPQHILFGNPIKTASQLVKMRKVCGKKHFNDEYCLLCCKVFCSKCEAHDQIHKKIAMHISLGDGTMVINSKVYSHKQKIYEDIFHEQWQSSKKPQDFKLNEKLFENLVNSFMLRKRPKMDEE